jgi:hypothetical protein
VVVEDKAAEAAVAAEVGVGKEVLRLEGPAEAVSVQTVDIVSGT